MTQMEAFGEKLAALESDPTKLDALKADVEGALPPGALGAADAAENTFTTDDPSLVQAAEADADADGLLQKYPGGSGVSLRGQGVGF
jgi:hypothetical protein